MRRLQHIGCVAHGLGTRHGEVRDPTGSPSPGADVAGASPVPVQMWEGRAPKLEESTYQSAGRAPCTWCSIGPSGTRHSAADSSRAALTAANTTAASSANEAVAVTVERPLVSERSGSVAACRNAHHGHCTRYTPITLSPRSCAFGQQDGSLGLDSLPVQERSCTAQHPSHAACRGSRSEPTRSDAATLVNAREWLGTACARGLRRSGAGKYTARAHSSAQPLSAQNTVGATSTEYPGPIRGPAGTCSWTSAAPPRAVGRRSRARRPGRPSAPASRA